MSLALLFLYLMQQVTSSWSLFTQLCLTFLEIYTFLPVEKCALLVTDGTIFLINALEW